MDATNILTLDEIRYVLGNLRLRLKRRYYREVHSRLVTFRLACCCGLRRAEIAGVNVGDMILTGDRPCLRVRKEFAKFKKARKVPLWWDRGTLKDFREWRLILEEDGVSGKEAPFLPGRHGRRLSGRAIAGRWDTAIQCLGVERAAQLSVHCGRHTFISHALANGRSIVEVRDAAGHSNLHTTSKYSHLLECEGVPDLFPEE